MHADAGECAQNRSSCPECLNDVVYFMAQMLEIDISCAFDDDSGIGEEIGFLVLLKQF